MVVVSGLAAHVNHAVDAAATAQGFATRITQAAAVQTGIGFSVQHPIGAGVANAIQVAHGDMDPVVVVSASGFKQKNPLGRIGTQAIG